MATLYSGLGGTAGYGEQSYRTSGYTGSLDDSYIGVNVTSVFGTAGLNVNGTSYSTLYIGSNGLITFASGVSTYTPGALTSLGQPVLAPFWTDIDIAKGGEIYWDLDPTTGKFTVTWLNAAPYSGTGTVSFQIQITALGAGDFNVEYLYGNIGYTNGGSGSAVAGTSNGVTQTLLEGSGNDAFLATYAGNDFDTNDPAGVYSSAFEAGQLFTGDGVVDGTGGDDLIGAAYTGDPDGDRIDRLDGTGFSGTTGEADYVLAGAGNDTVQSGLGNDIVYGGTGNDQITTAQGNDWADGGSENDSLDGGSGHDTLYGGSGNDSLTGGADSTATTYTPSYAEVLVSTPTQSVAGTSGRPNFSVRSTSNETLTAGSNGTLSGYRLGDGDATETHTHAASSQVSGGQIQFNGINSTETLTITLDGVTLNLNTALANGTVSFNGAGVYQLNGAGQIVRIGSGSSSTTIGTLTINVPYTTVSLSSTGGTSGGNAGLWYKYFVNTQPNDVASAAGGNDQLFGETGDDLIDGSNGNDSLYGGADNDTVYGGTGEDWVDLGSGDDVFGASGTEAGNDTVYGGAGNDTLTGGAGNDQLFGGDGRDSFLIADDHQGDTIIGGEGGTDVDLISFGNAAAAQGVTVTFTGNEAGTFSYVVTPTTGGAFSEIEAISGTAYADQISGAAATTATITIWGNAGNDTLQGGGANDSIYGGADNDQILGNGGDDLLQGDDGADNVDGGSGADQLFGGAGNDTLTGSTGNDTLWGEAGSDSLSGGDDADLLYGGADGDTLIGDAGADLLYGGDGNDSLAGGTGNDTVLGDAGADTINAGQGMDWVDYSASGAGVTVDLSSGTGAGGDAQGDVLAGVDALLGSAYDDALYGFDGFSTDPSDAYTNIFFGNAGNDYLDGRGGDDSLYGGADNDTILGGGGADLVDGGTGNDSLLGGDGADTLLGGAGNDTLTGGAGADSLDGGTGDETFAIGLGSEAYGDTVAGGENSGDNDVLDLTAWGWSLTNIIYDPMNAENGTVEFLDGNGAVIGSMTFSGIEQVIPCFTPGTLIVTERGEVAVEDLQPGDRVMTRDNGLQELRWIGRRDLSIADLIVKPMLRPVEIAQGALGFGLPMRDMKVSPQHRMLIEGARAEMLFGEAEVLVAATHLTALPGIAQKLTAGVSYIHLLFDRHEIICADGAWTESFQPAMRMLNGMEDAQRAEIAELFPELAQEDFDYPAARLSLKAHEARVLLAE